MASDVEMGVRQCAAADALAIVGERWALLVVRELFWGVHRFSDIQRHTGAPRDVLSARLKLLCDEGILEKRPYSTKPPRSEYHLTPAGRELGPVLSALSAWGEKHRPTDGERPHPSHHGHAMTPIVRVECSTCGDELVRLG